MHDWPNLTGNPISGNCRELKAGTAAGRELKIAGRPGDRIRMFLKNRYGDNRPIELTPWGVDGIIQKGLTLEGSPILEEMTEPPDPS